MGGATVPAPKLEGQAKAAVEHRGSHLQIIAAAGSGKTEVVSQRVAALLAEGVPSRGIVAFTFTERAAEELRLRIARRVEDLIGREALDQLTGLFVGTIHAYCFRLLQQHVPRYETYDVLDENQLTALLSREGNRLEIRQLDDRKRLFASVGRFAQGMDVIENELIDLDTVPDPFRTIAVSYYATLERYRLLTFGRQIVCAVEALERPEVAAAVHADLRHLIVDEYQDVNPAQERLIQLLSGPDVELCVVGDDDQAVYQWRGSAVDNIVTFAKRYPNVAQYEITTNRRSRPGIVETANSFARSIPDRLDKQMSAAREATGSAPPVVLWYEDKEVQEAGRITERILHLHDTLAIPFRSIAVLVRTSAAYRQLIEQFAAFDVPVQPAGRTGLFEQPEATTLGKTFAWLTDVEWRVDFGRGSAVGDQELLDDYQRIFDLGKSHGNRVRRILEQWKELVPKQRNADLVGEYYELLDTLDVRRWSLEDPIEANRVGTLARFTNLLADYESVRRRARADEANEGEQVGGEFGGLWFYKNLALHIVNYAAGAYDGFDGETDYVLDAVDLTTIHRAKGLEWPVVFVPSLTKKRFPSSKMGSERDWAIPRDLFDAERYEGSDADERRLFYVAITRGRDWVSVSRHKSPNKQTVQPSPYYQDLAHLEVAADSIAIPPIELPSAAADEPITISYSELAAYLDCGAAFRLRNLFGFQPRLAPELGYGKAVHHVLRTVAERTRETGAVPTKAELDQLIESNFFLPTANKAAHAQMKIAASRLIDHYRTENEADLHRVWETERPFELHLDRVIVQGRADVILDQEGGVPTGLAIVDYKTSTSGDVDAHALQLQVYADAGRREGLDVRGTYVHDLKAAVEGRDATITIDSSPGAIASAEELVVDAAQRIRNREYPAAPGQRCRTCEVRTVCATAKR